jgi:hypothetical protein
MPEEGAWEQNTVPACKSYSLVLHVETNSGLCSVGQIGRGSLSADNVYFGLHELRRQLEILEKLVGQERPQAREGWKR